MSLETVALLEKASGALVGETERNRAALAAALALVGEHEVGGQNKGPIVEFCIGYWVEETPEEWALWCAGFVSTMYLIAETVLALRSRLSREPERGELEKALGQPSPWRKIGSLQCSTLWERASARKWTSLYPDAEAQPGDIVFFSGRAEPDKTKHVGLVVGQKGRTLLTVEGNAGNSVRRRTYDLSFERLYGLARPVW